MGLLQDPHPKRATLVLIDGMPAQDAVRVGAGVDGKQCAKCCAAHGSDPFFCCRCGATWRPA